MANYNCDACNELRNDAPNLIVNGLTNTECTSLKNNTGLNPSSGNDDCTDLDNMNDCLIGNLEAEVDAYDVCDWKDFTKKYIENAWTVFKGIICAICGLWTNIKKILKEIDKIWCWLEHMTKNTGGVLHAYVDDDPSKQPINGFRIAQGVKARTGANTAPLNISIIGSTARVTGSLTFDGKMPSSYTNGASVDWLDFFDGGTEVTNTAGNSSYKGNTPNGNFFVYEYQVDPCEYGFKSLYAGNLFSADAGDYQFRISTYAKGDEYPFDYGLDANGNGQIYNPTDPNKVLIQVRLVNMRTWGITRNNGRITPNGITMAIPCKDSWDC